MKTDFIEQTARFCNGGRVVVQLDRRSGKPLTIVIVGESLTGWKSHDLLSSKFTEIKLLIFHGISASQRAVCQQLLAVTEDEL